MSTLLASDDVGPSILSISAFLSPAECAAWVSWGETSGFEQEKHAQTRWIAHRDNGRLAVQSESIAAALWSRLAPLMPTESTRRNSASQLFVATGCPYLVSVRPSIPPRTEVFVLIIPIFVCGFEPPPGWASPFE